MKIQKIFSKNKKIVRKAILDHLGVGQFFLRSEKAINICQKLTNDNDHINTDVSVLLYSSDESSPGLFHLYAKTEVIPIDAELTLTYE